MAGAVWRNDGRGWRCTECAPIMAKWMKGCTPEKAKEYLKRLGWSYEWI